MAGIEHRLVDIQSAKDPINASDFVALARDEIEKGQAKGKIIFLIGGSAFYLRALIKGMYETETTPDEIKKDLDKIYSSKGIEPILEILREKDPESLSQLHVNDHYRLIRAAEFFLTTGEKISDEKKKMDELNPYDLSSSKWDIFHIYLNPPKKIHLQIIEKRTRKMLEMGLIHEVSNLLKMGFTGKEKPLSSIGYKEARAYLNGDLKDIESLIERISISTRQLAKSQRTFFKKITPKNTYDPLEDEEKVLEDVVEFLHKNYMGQA